MSQDKVVVNNKLYIIFKINDTTQHNVENVH